MQTPSPIRLQLDPDAIGATAQGPGASGQAVRSVGRIEVPLGRLLGVDAEGVRVLQGDADTAIDAALLTLLHPGDVVVAVVNGPLSAALAERAGRAGAEVIVVEHGPGEGVDLGRVEAALWARGAKLCLSVHADLATGRSDDPAALCALAREHAALALVDCRATLGVAAVDAKAWGAEVICAGGAAALGAAAGLAIVGLGPGARAAMAERRSPPLAWTLDLVRGRDHAALSPALLSGLDQALAAFEAAGPAAVRRGRAGLRDSLAAGLSALGLPLVPTTAPALVFAAAPEGVDVARVQRRMVETFGVEVGVLDGGRGWRCSLLSPDVTPIDIRITLAAFCDALAHDGLRSDFAAALSAADLPPPKS